MQTRRLLHRSYQILWMSIYSALLWFVAWLMDPNRLLYRLEQCQSNVTWTLDSESFRMIRSVNKLRALWTVGFHRYQRNELDNFLHQLDSCEYSSINDEMWVFYTSMCMGVNVVNLKWVITFFYRCGGFHHDRTFHDVRPHTSRPISIQANIACFPYSCKMLAFLYPNR